MLKKCKKIYLFINEINIKKSLLSTLYEFLYYSEEN
jgi:hypothetical protein